MGLAMERKRQRIGLLGRIEEEAEDRSVGSCRGKEMAENRYFIFVWEEGNGRASKEKAFVWEEGNGKASKEKAVVWEEGNGRRQSGSVLFFLFYYFLFFIF